MKTPVLLAVAVLVTVVGVARAQSDAVTMSLSTYRNANGVLVLAFSGSVSSGAAGEQVEVLGQDCGARASRLLSATQTRPGGGWRLENPESTAPYRSFNWGSGMTFRARWRDGLSDPVTFRVPARPFAVKVPGRRVWRVLVTASPLVRMTGKVVELQRQAGSSWVRTSRAKLVHKPSFDFGPYNYEARFTIERRGLRLRASLPRASALPCFLAAASEPWRS